MKICQFCLKPTRKITADDIVKWLLSLKSDEERQNVVDAITEHICIHCGSTYLPCHCRNDD